MIARDFFAETGPLISFKNNVCFHRFLAIFLLLIKVDRHQGGFVFGGLMIEIEKEESPRKSRSRTGGLDFERVTGGREKVDICGRGLDTAPTETVGQTHGRRRREVTGPLVRRQ